MPRSIVPRSTRTMYGTVTPWSVVVVARSGGGFDGSYAANCLRQRGAVLVGDHRRRVALRVGRGAEPVVGRRAEPRLHLRAGEHRAADRVVRDRDPHRGRTRGGRSRRSSRRRGPRRRPGSGRRARQAKARADVPGPDRDRRRAEARVARSGMTIWTSASPPEIRSARFESTRIASGPVSASAAAGEAASSRTARAEGTPTMKAATSSKRRAVILIS